MQIRAEHLVKRYRRRAVVDGISLEVSQGEIVGLLGRNGAGKTTTFYMVVGLVKPEGGHVWLDDRDITRVPMFERARSGIGYLPQEASIFRKISVEENLRMVLEMSGLPPKEQRQRVEGLIEEFNLSQVRYQPGISLSGGERRRVEIARCMALRPRFILLDEPFTGVDPIEVNAIQRMVADLKSRHIGILITDHNVSATLATTDRSYIVKNGRIMTAGAPEEIAGDPVARREYLGENFRLEMKLLDRYILRELAGPFLFGMVLFITVIVSGEYLFKLTSYIANGAPFLPVLELFGLRIVTVSVLSMPAAMLMATLLAFGRLSGDSELVAIQAGGVPLYRVAYMSVVFGLAVSVIAFITSEFFIPPSAQTSRKIDAMIVAAIRNEVVKEAGAGKWFVVQDFDGGQLARLVVARNFDPAQGRMEDVTFIEYANNRPKMLVEAKSAEYAGTNQWRFRDARFTAIDPVDRDKHIFVRKAPEAYITLNKTPETVAKDIKDPDEMSSRDLRDYIKGLKARQVPPRVITRLNTVLQDKLSVPFASLVFAVLGTPLGVRRQRSSAAMGVGLSLFILFAYYVLWHSMTIVGENGQLPPVVASWTANVVALVIGFALTIKVSR